MKLLVTGSAGFIGFHLSKQLLADGHAVVGVVSLNSYYDLALKEKRNKMLNQTNGYIFYNNDISNISEIDVIIRDEAPDMIVHLAAQAGVRYSLVNPTVYIQSNVLGTMNVYESAKEHGVKRVIMASSSSVYGKNTKIPFHEDDVTDSPASLYAATKKSCEHIAHTYNHLYGIESACLRFFTVYGPWYRPDMALFKFSNNILQDIPIKLFNNGDMKRDFTHINDIVDGIIAVADKKDLDFEVYNLGSNNPIELERVVSLLEDSLGKKAVKEYYPMQAGDVKVTYADITKSREHLGFEPKMTIEEGVNDFGSWFTGNKDWLLSLENGK